jgi:hypothetical protein
VSETTVIVKALLTEPDPLVAVTVTAKDPMVEGVPEMSPLAELITRPGGSPLAV